ncbi:secretin [Rhinolophus sinicus]|uniref:secretin n=1 Tax=Rhinolophus sinicus TaxID=89399 RepID=UPI0009441A53|nr:PREDICTED: secretin [Rhinolophus sinicus]XP_019570374.1 PREDICTED: secretin [Rhinolophus sinicus]
MAPGALLLLLLLSPLLQGSAGRPAPLRAPRHSDGTFTSELSRLRESARLQRLLQGLVGKRSEQDAENSTSWTGSATEPAEVPLCLLWSHSPVLQAWMMAPRDPLNQAWSPRLSLGLKSGVMVSEPAIPAETQMRS